AGNNLANRAKITINDDVYTVDEKEYVAFSAAAGWGGLTENRYPISLKAGENVITIENVLTLVNEEKTEEVSEDTPGAVLVSNWWCENIRFEAVPQIELVIDTTNAKTIYNLNRDFIDSNLRVIYKVDGEETELTPEQYTIDSSGFNNQALGSYRIYVMMNDSELESYYNVSVIEEGLPFEGQVLEFNGEGTGADTYSYYNYAKIIGEGEGIYNDRLFWTVANQKLKDGGYTFGSNGVGNDENRQMTLTLMINSTVSGKFIIKSYAECYQEPQGNLIIKVNENDPYTINTFFTNLDTPFMFEVDLVVGLNTVEMKFSDAYAAWLRYFEITPIDYSDIDESFIPKNGVRSSLGFLDSNNDYVWKTKAGNSSLNYYLKVEEAFSYKFIINTVNNTATNGKLFIDGVAYDFTVGTNNQAIAIVDLAAGDHNLVLNFLASADEHFGFVDMTVAKNAVPEEITLDTSDINLTVNYDGIFDTTALKVTVKFNDGTSRELLRSEYKVIMPTGYDTKVPGEYTIRIELLSDSEMYETFKVTVQEKPVDPDENPDDENPIETPVDEEPSSPKVRIEFVIGAALVAVALLVSAFVLIRRRRKL
ncbi:MAG: hypothetical protein GX896_01370, partial [Clostridiales bacterium]|nr:hypothetical protein [Clostridiales bacterium]